ncbi:NYN domain-containing protein [Nocardia australiensis]|uniref:NYN domain-containing protein n=1 Tax=Nocardia australiensis TaxID=2887191 RepID=UPI001D13D8C2|nr:NYN domain-containing protein [Nocardia australiensis]
MADSKLKRSARRRSTVGHQGTLVLDCAGLSRLVDDSVSVVALLAEARARGMEVVTSALTIIEATHAKTGWARLTWLLSGIRVEQVDETTAKAASLLLGTAGLHGHKCAIDAVVAEMAVRQHHPVVILTSDPSDMRSLCGDAVRLIAT